MRNDRGVVLPLALMMLMILSSLTVGVVGLAGLEPQISRNLVDTNQARFAAEAGIEWAYNRLVVTPDWDTLLSGANADGVVLVANATIGTLSAAHGTYTVTVRNDNRATDPQLTGVTPPDAGGETDDQNGNLIVTAVGTKGTATTRLRAIARREGADFLTSIPAAFSLPGVDAEAYFRGTGFQIDGRGWKNGLGSQSPSLDADCASRYGIAVSLHLPTGQPGANEGVVEGALSGSQKSKVQGKGQSNPSATATGNGTIAPDAALEPTKVQAFIDAIKGRADLVYHSAQPNGLSFHDVTWGTPSAPKIVYIKGDQDPTSAFAALQVDGNSSGYGILAVEDGDFRVNGNLTWHGLIVVTGDWVGIGFMGGTPTIYGAVISNETSTDPGYKEGYVTGAATVRYSCEALDMVRRMRGLANLSSYKELAPGE